MGVVTLNYANVSRANGSFGRFRIVIYYFSLYIYRAS